MRDLNHQLNVLCRKSFDGSYSTQASRSRMLDLIASQLKDMGFHDMQPDSLKPKHVKALVQKWQDDGIAIGTLKNRMSTLRWWARKIHKQNVVARDNRVYGIEARQLITYRSKGQTLNPDKFNRIKDEYTRLSVRLQAAFGLRREEAIKFQPRYAIQGDYIALRASWTKGGRPRVIPITSDEQRQLLSDVKHLAKGGALIPSHLTYVQQLHRYERQLRNAGLTKLHGLRHSYAQQRYLTLTGWPCPAMGGPTSKSLTPVQKLFDHEVRLQISHELGHSRINVTAVYLGK